VFLIEGFAIIAVGAGPDRSAFAAGKLEKPVGIGERLPGRTDNVANFIREKTLRHCKRSGE